eukprot:scaffold54074_cov60-Phaeocystis_antarctica.AAC.2
MPARAVAPSAPMPLHSRLRARGGMGAVREQACQWVLTQKRTLSGRALERSERRRRGQQLAQHDRSRHADVHLLQVELRDVVLTQGDERDPAEVGHNGVLQYHFGQMVGGISRDVVEADAVSAHSNGMKGTKRGWAGDVRESVRFLVSGR